MWSEHEILQSYHYKSTILRKKWFVDQWKSLKKCTDVLYPWVFKTILRLYGVYEVYPMEELHMTLLMFIILSIIEFDFIVFLIGIQCLALFR
jgi:hypothetical protein